MQNLLVFVSVLVGLCHGQDRDVVSEAELSGCPCIALYQPVCGENGQSYSNSCVAECNDVTVQCEGKCPCAEDPVIDFPGPIEEPQPCPKLLKPVCTENDNTFDNECEAERSGEEILCEGKCPCTNGCPFCCINNSPKCKLVRVACNGCPNT
ncbi:hypothetical protein TCAL_08242 [Tigriopus californicus]|uniref:Kazal-like domain-containing protein n=1 Tax=Tigriopus californicus TaxID=6832 RepID=A0A553NZB4_TIGCA|nr:serine protease inhibitor dipetalogastin-like [Tigriopus californicus]TRY70765.1 hypothetical protein TCAL_08242 [Tigriopus californicus]|eukprot:TCALIF_08242-PA protein Name:"Similar to Leech-derived tryptase inhibitor C (Hirudo medicinalis)" AED:0.00 eAED:0.00 QI:72/1/1/1/0.5/0.66/3/14/151